MKFFTRCLFGLLFLFFLFVFSATLLLGRDDLIGSIIIQLHQEKNASKIYDLITIGRFHLLQCLVFSVLLLAGILLFYFNRIYTVAVFYIRDFSGAILTCFRTCFRSEVKYVLILPVLASVWFAIQLPVSYDEAYTYLNFTSRGPLASAFYYPAPNNHILHSLITNVTAFIPFLSINLCLRISSIAVNLLTWCIAYSFLASHFTKRVALVVVAIASLLGMTIYYSYMSRGYALVSLFFVSSLYAVFNNIKTGGDKRNWIAFAISSILGFYAMPSFLYAFLTLNVFIFLFKPHDIKKQVLVNVAVAFSTACLYVPVVIANGAAALVNNRYVTPLPRMEVLQKLPSFCSNAITNIVGIHWSFILILLLIAVIILVLKKKKQLLLLYAVFLAAPVVWLLLHAVIPFSRTFVYYNIILVLLLVLPLSSWLDKQKNAYVFSALVLIQWMLLWNFNSQIYDLEDYSIKADKVCKRIAGDKKYVCDDGLFDAHLRFELIALGYNKPEILYFNQVEMSADTIYDKDYIIIQKNLDKTIKKQPVIETPYYRVYN